MVVMNQEIFDFLRSEGGPKRTPARVEVGRSTRNATGSSMKTIKISKYWNFGNNRELAKKLEELVLSGKKRATTGLYQDNERIPVVGDYEAILDSSGNFLCVVLCTHSEVKNFLEVGPEFIEKEGEDDESVERWREKHRTFFNLKDDNVRVICEEFEVVCGDKANECPME